MIEGTVKYEGSGDVYVAAYIDGVKTNGPFPSRANVTFDKADCNNNAILNFDIANWKASVTELTEANTKCNIYFNTRTKYSNMIYEMMANLAKTDTTNLAYDGTVGDSNLRYIGKEPNNYVTFNDETAGWRIIGSFKDIDDGTGRIEWRTKIIKTASLGDKVWDNDTINNHHGINEWSTSDIKIYLNDAYYLGLKQEAKDMIGEAMWNLGTNGGANYMSAIPSAFYEYERSSNTGKICSDGPECNDTITRTTKWTGKIGLMYPSDYGYATGGSTRVTCLNTALNSWNNNSSCYNNDWLFNSANQWTMTPNATTFDASRVFAVSSDGTVLNIYANNLIGVYPVVFISSNVMITGGSGTSADPYTLGLQ